MAIKAENSLIFSVAENLSTRFPLSLSLSLSLSPFFPKELNEK